jgi:hypothetical protein
MRRMFEKLQRIIFWSWNMRDNFDFDYAYTEKVLLFKLKRLRDTMNTCSFHRNLQDLYKDLSEMDENTSEFDREHTTQLIQCYRALDIVVKILERRNKYDFYDDLVGLPKFMDTYTTASRVELENQLKMNVSHKIELDNSEYWRRLKPLMYLSKEVEARDKKWLYDLLRMYSDGWWI